MRRPGIKKMFVGRRIQIQIWQNYSLFWKERCLCLKFILNLSVRLFKKLRNLHFPVTAFCRRIVVIIAMLLWFATELNIYEMLKEYNSRFVKWWCLHGLRCQKRKQRARVLLPSVLIGYACVPNQNSWIDFWVIFANGLSLAVRLFLGLGILLLLLLLDMALPHY